MEQQDNQHFAVELCKLVYRGCGRHGYSVDVKIYSSCDRSKVYQEDFIANSLEDLADKMVEEGILLKPPGTIESIPRAQLGYLYDTVAKCPIGPHDIFDFEKAYYKKAVAKFGDAAKGDDTQVQIKRLPF